MRFFSHCAPSSTQNQLDMLNANMLPSLRKLVPKNKVTSVDRLVQLVESKELLEEERNFSAPLPPELSVLASVAYKEPEERSSRRISKLMSDRCPVNIARIVALSIQRLAEMIAKLVEQQLKRSNAQYVIPIRQGQ